jgi:hypothetical protein
MKRIALISLIFILSVSAKSQNLIPNNNFEYYTNCPTNYDQLYLTLPWQSASGGTPDYYNSCSNFPNVPLCGGGFQNALSGNAFIGLYGYVKWPNTSNTREYAQVELIDSLKTGSWYCVSFYCNLADFSDYAINRLGAYISDTAIYRNDISYFPLTPQIENPASNFLSSKVNWMQISGLYQAHGGEKFVTIGNFYSDTLTDTLKVPAGLNSLSYYFIEDVSVINCDSLMGLHEQSNISFTLSPIPASEVLKITLPLNVSSTAFTIVNTMGTIVKQEESTTTQNEIVINIAILPRGAYFVKVKTNKGIGFKKFLKM